MIDYSNRYQWAVFSLLGVALCVVLIVLAFAVTFGLNTTGLRLVSGGLLILLAAVLFSILS